MKLRIVNRKATAYRTAFITTVFLFFATLPLAADQVSDGLSRCRSENNAAARLACYDALSGRQASAPVASGKTGDPPTNESMDDLGSESVRPSGDPKAEKLSIRATITRCRRGENKRYHFYFANGQVWTQSDRKRLNFDNCEFDITITKDFFGYKMQPDGDKSRIRITRVK